MKKILTLVLTVGLFCTLPVSSQARPAGFRGMGPRVGLTVNPDQFHFGGHIDFGDIAPRWMMIPNIEIGVGDDFTTIAPTFELDYRFRDNWGVWTPYLGGGIGPIFYSHKNGASASEVALYLQFGIGKGSVAAETGHFFIEGKLGLVDAPDFKATVGWTFGN
ncbi:MAG: hypothetical protein SGI97_09780 [candidate division Zixibacteria bacterium]|nr:hypothetical protein [candidate division Zixibacteria bacterium]